jgi:hypothetical protein
MHSDALRCTQMHSDALRCTQWPQAKRTSRGAAIQIWSSAIKGNQGRSHLARRGHTDLAFLGYAGLPRYRFPFHSRHGALILREPLLALFLGLRESQLVGHLIKLRDGLIKGSAPRRPIAAHDALLEGRSRGDRILEGSACEDRSSVVLKR